MKRNKKTMETAVKSGLCEVAAVFALAVLGAGCVAVNVGRPETFTNTQTVTETATVPSSREVTEARGRSTQSGNRVEVGIDAEVLEGYPRTRYEETVVVRRQKRLAIGLFPGAAERFLMPEGALDSGVAHLRPSHNGAPGQYALYYVEGSYFAEHAMSVLALLGIPYAVGSVNSLLVQPFAGWSCKHDYLDKGCLKPQRSKPYGLMHWDNSESPKIRALNRFPESERKKIGVTTCFDRHAGTGGFGAICTHMGLVGCHKYLAVFVEPVQRGEGEAAKAKTQSRRADVEGPYVAELSIPALGWSRTVRVGKGVQRAEFTLPAAARPCVAGAVVRFRADGMGDASEVTRGALEKVSGQEYRFDVTLQGGAGASATASVPAAVPKPKAGGGAYEVVGITPSGEGKYEVRVRIADKTKTFDVGWAVEPDVKRMIREDFVKRHPGTGIQYVREMVEWETEEDGAVLVYRGWAFSARPVSDGWAYDDGTRRGTVRLRISEGMPADEAKRWARENIEAIVKEKNVALEAGKAPPEGAMYRSLGESLKDGVLTVEFEAVE